MKRFATLLCLLLALCLMPLWGLAAPAKAPNELFGTLLMDEGGSIGASTVLDGVAYLLTSKLYSYRAGDDKPQQLANYGGVYDEEDEANLRPYALFAHEGQLMGLDTNRKKLFPIQTSDGMPINDKALALDWSVFGTGEDHEPPQYITAYEGKLYCKQGNYGSELKADLHSFDIKTGEVKSYKPLHLQGLVPYKEGKLLGIRFDQNEGREVDGKYQQAVPEIHVFDPAKDESHKLDLRLFEGPSYENSRLSLYYDKGSDQVYAASSAGLFRLSQGAEPVLTGRLPTAGTWNEITATPSVHPWQDGQLLLAIGYNAYLRGTDEKALPPVTELLIEGNSLENQALIRSMMALPELAIASAGVEGLSSESVNAQFLGRDMKHDLLSMHSSGYDLQRLMQKGYLLDLTDDPALSALGQDSLDQLRPAMYLNDRLYLLPVGLFAGSNTANAKHFQEIGRPIPTTIQELLDLVKWWAEEGHASHEGYQLFEYGNIKESMVYQINDIYVEGLLGQGKPLQYDMATFGHFMQQLSAIDTRDIEPDPDNMEEMGKGGGENGTHEPKSLISPFTAYHLREPQPGEQTVPMPLSIDKDTAPWRQANIMVLGIPATTQHPEAAKRLLASYLGHLSDRQKAVVSKSMTGPVLNPSYEETLQKYRDDLAMQEQRLKEAEGASKHELQAIVDKQRQYIADYEQSGKYSLSEETIAQHKAFVKLTYVDNSLTMVLSDALSDKDGNSLLRMYVQGAISLEQFIQQANDKIRLITLETQ